MRSQIQNLLIDAAEIHSVKYVIRFGMSISNGIRKLFHSWKKWKIIKTKKANILCRARYKTSEAESLTDNKHRTTRESEEDWYLRSRSG